MEVMPNWITSSNCSWLFREDLTTQSKPTFRHFDRKWGNSWPKLPTSGWRRGPSCWYASSRFFCCIFSYFSLWYLSRNTLDRYEYKISWEEQSTNMPDTTKVKKIWSIFWSKITKRMEMFYHVDMSDTNPFLSEALICLAKITKQVEMFYHVDMPDTRSDIARDRKYEWVLQSSFWS